MKRFQKVESLKSVVQEPEKIENQPWKTFQKLLVT